MSGMCMSWNRRGSVFGWLFAALLVATAVCMSGCSGKSKPAVDGKTPPFKLKLRGHTHDHRFTYFEVNEAGQMRYGGGRDASFFESKPDINLTADQRAQVWRIIVDQQVAETKDAMFADFKSIEYHCDIWTSGALGRAFRTVDDRAPGVKALHDLLFKFHLDAGTNLPGLPSSGK